MSTMAKKVDRRAARIQAALEGKPATDLELAAAAAFQATTRRIAAAMARELHLDPKTMQDYGNADSGDRGPHLLLLLITQLAIEVKGRTPAAFAALDFVEQQLGRVVLDLSTSHGELGTLAQQITGAMVQVLEFVDVVDDGGEPTEQRRLEAHQAMQEAMTMLKKLCDSFGKVR